VRGSTGCDSAVLTERERERDTHTHTHTERERERERERPIHTNTYTYPCLLSEPCKPSSYTDPKLNPGTKTLN
jgi:hypothetical protein